MTIYSGSSSIIYMVLFLMMCGQYTARGGWVMFVMTIYSGSSSIIYMVLFLMMCGQYTARGRCPSIGINFGIVHVYNHTPCSHIHCIYTLLCGFQV